MTKPMDKIKDRVAAVVVTYNRAEMLRQCLMSLQKQTMPCDILVVDNASTDDTQALVQRAAQHDASIFYRNTGENLGGAGGFNFGMRWAVEAGYAFVWLWTTTASRNRWLWRSFWMQTVFCRASMAG